VQVVAVGARGAGYRFGRAPEARSTLSAKAQRLGLRTRQDVEREYQAQRVFGGVGDGWSRGTEWHCALCDRDFCSESGARKHRDRCRHPVLRWDWYDLPAPPEPTP
jgi:hypothetical protein